MKPQRIPSLGNTGASQGSMNRNDKQGPVAATDTVQRVAGENWMTDRIANISAQEAARFLGISTRDLKELRRRRVFAYYRIGHRTVTYHPLDLVDFLDKCRVAPVGEAKGSRSHSR